MEDESLHAEGDEREVNLVQVLLEEDADLQQRARREPRHTHAAISLESEERTEALLAAARRSELDSKVRDAWADVPEAVWRPWWNDENVTGTQGAPP